MLTIDIGNIYFALDTNFSIRISYVNPACYTDKIRSEAGLGLNIPVNDINRGILGAPERFAKYFPAGNPGLKFPGCSIRFGGALLLSGSLVVIQATSESYECWVQSNLGVMGEKLQNKTLQDMPWPTNQAFVAKETPYDSHTLRRLSVSGQRRSVRRRTYAAKVSSYIRRWSWERIPDAPLA